MFSTSPRLDHVAFDYRRYVHALPRPHSDSRRDSVARVEGLLHELVHGPESAQQRGAWTEPRGPVPLVHVALPHRADPVPAGPAAHQAEVGGLAAPGDQDELGIA